MKEYWIDDNGVKRLMTEEEIAEYEKQQEYFNSAEFRIPLLKQQLADTDYQAIKHSEGWLTDEEYAPIKEQRQAIRDEINRLESDLK